MEQNKKLLLVIDMQNDFIDGALGTKEAEKIVENVNEKILEYRNSNDIVVFTRDTHDNDYTCSESSNVRRWRLCND